MPNPSSDLPSAATLAAFWLVALGFNRSSGAPISELAREMGLIKGLEEYHLSHASN